MSFANASMDEMEIAESRYLLCLVPQNINLFNTLQIVIITPMRLLKRGYDVYFKADNTMCHCYSLVYCILGDHPSQVLCAGMFQFFQFVFQVNLCFIHITGLAQGSWGLCQYCHNLSAFFHEVEWPIKVGG